MYVKLTFQVFDNSTDSCTTNFSISGQPLPCTEAVATAMDLFHFVFDQVEKCEIVSDDEDDCAGSELPGHCEHQF